MLCILVLGILTYVRGMYLKLKTSFSRKNVYVLGLILNYISFKAKSKSHMNIWELKNIAKWKIKRSVSMFQELWNLEYFLVYV